MDIFIINFGCAENIDGVLLNSFRNANIHNEKRQQQHCLSYLMADRILKEVYHIDNREIIYKNNKPYLKSGEKYITISHSEELIALAFSDSNCGIDIEKIRSRNYKKISERMNFQSSNLEEFYANWTEYEARYKLQADAKSLKQFIYDDFYLTAVSISEKEKFEIYIQN